jgi:hypothetical protein
MRKIDKLKNYEQANLRLEQIYLNSKKLMNEDQQVAYAQSPNPAEKPKSITIELTNKFKEDMQESSETTNGLKGFARDSRRIELYNNGNRYNLEKVGTIPYDVKRDLQFDFWASYRPKANEIYVNQSNSTAKDLENSMLKDDSIPSTAGIVSKLEPYYYCKFENGFKVGEVDHRGFFKIVEVK